MGKRKKICLLLTAVLLLTGCGEEAVHTGAQPAETAAEAADTDSEVADTEESTMAEPADGKNAMVLSSDIREMLEQAQRDGQERTLWFIGSFNSREDVVDEWREAGFEVKELENCLLERYWFKLYKISGFRPY